MSGALDQSGKPHAEPAEATERRVLFLQGPLSPFFRLAGDHLKAMGHEVFRINFCAGDWFHWHGGECTSFKGSSEDWPQFIETYLTQNRITDLVLHGDQRLYHRIAIRKARDIGVYIAVTELGALRTGWMTLERNGLSTLSHFPSNPEQISEIARTAEEIDLQPRYPSSFWLQTAPDVTYNLLNVFLKPLYPNYQQHTIYPPVLEYMRGAGRLVSEDKRNRTAEEKLQKLQSAKIDYFLLPLQLEGDFQLRRHSNFDSFSEVIETVFASFSSHASRDVHIVLKSHPLDVGFEDWPGVTKELASKHGLADRVHFLDGGGLAKPFETAKGVVTLNSTAGLEAIQQGVPVKTLVPAHYDIAGLTHQGELSDFWKAPQRPDAELFDSYIKALAATTQIRGTIHNAEGVKVAAKNLAERVSARSLNPLGAFVDPPPRLEKARKIGVPL